MRRGGFGIGTGAIVAAAAGAAVAGWCGAPRQVKVALASASRNVSSSQSPPRPQRLPVLATELAEVRVVGARLRLTSDAITASQGIVSHTEVTLLPAYRPAQLLETVPGMAATVHSGEGKASQYMMRGYNLDHGTDFAFYVDGMPINEPTHAHGQGYSDLNFLIPELISGLTYTKGTYYAEEGDFASVGSAHISYADTIPIKSN